MGNKIIKKIVHISTVHSWRDPRIFDKECCSLADQNFDVTLITPDGINEKVRGVSVLQMSPFYKFRLLRSTISSYYIVKQALALNPHIIHFHDPEIIPAALFFKNKNVKFVYDIHEDYVTDIKQKKYVPFFLRNIIAFITRFFERRAHKSFTTIIAEKYYGKIFPTAKEILNYPIIDWSKDIVPDRENATQVLYTGNITKDRGAMIHSDILMNVDRSTVSGITMIGRCEKKLSQKMMNYIGKDNLDRLNIIGIDDFIEFDKIIDEYKKGKWIAGLAIFPKTPHYAEKHLTKFFEYMAAGLPIIYSNYEEWENLLKPLDVGISINPSDKDGISEAVRLLKTDQKLRKRMALNGRDAVLKKFNWKTEAEKLVFLYESIS
ncbi:MAG: glycosyltransferase [Balneola sp.]